MEKEKTYEWTRFAPETIRKAFVEFSKHIKDKQESIPYVSKFLSVSRGVESWNHDSEAEFFADYIKGFELAMYRISYLAASFKLDAFSRTIPPRTTVTISLKNRSEIESVFAVFEDAASSSVIPRTPKPPEPPWESRVKVFIGHGGNPMWRDLKDHLVDQQGIHVEAYEIGARAGHAIRDVLDDMLTKSSFAILVLTGEVEDKEGRLHARDNVVHELGLFQGRLGWSKAVVLLEEGVSEFSNIHGVQQIRFPKGRIRETFGDILATLKREFSTGTE